MPNDAVELSEQEQSAIVEYIVQHVTDVHREYNDPVACKYVLYKYGVTLQKKYSPETAAELKRLALERLTPLLRSTEGPPRNSPMTPIG